MDRLDKSTLRTIYNTGILPPVLYGILIWGNCTQHLLDDAEKIHIKAACHVKCIKKTTLNPCPLLTGNHLYTTIRNNKTYKTYNELTSPLHSKFMKSAARRTQNQVKFDQLSFRFVSFKRSFTYRSAIVWNNIPQNICEKEPLDSFNIFCMIFFKIFLF